MRSIFLFLFLTTCFGRAFSQNRFYLRPAVETGYCKTHPLRSSLSPPWYKFKTKRFVWTQGVDVGIILGYQFNKNRTCLETGLRQASAVSDWELSFLEYIPSANGGGTYSNSHLAFRDGVQGIKISILLSTQVCSWDSLKLNKPRSFSLHCNFIMGINIHRKKYQSYLPKIDKTVMLSPDTLMNVQSYTYSGYAPHTILPEIGLSVELRKQQQEWGALSVYCLLSVGRHPSWGLGQSISMKVTDVTTNRSLSYSNDSGSGGNGVCVEISKKLFYPKKRVTKFIKD
jgi:hypothetical protein